MKLKHALLVVLLIDALLLWPFVYVNGYGHGDIDEMHMALFMPTDSVPVYGNSFSFGWYGIARVLQTTFSLSSDRFPAVINSVAVLGATIGDLFLVATLASVLPIGTALGATLLWRLTPEVWEVSTYAHPWTLAFPFFFAGTWLAASAAGSSAPRRNWAIAAVLFAAAFAIRIDLILFVPLLLVADYLRSRRLPVPLTISLAAAGALLFAVQQLTAGKDLTSVVLASFWQELTVRSVAVNLAVFAYGGGLATLLLLAIATPRFAASRDRRWALLLFVCALLPTVLPWGVHGGAARHFGPVYLAAAILAALLLAERLHGPTVALAIAALVVMNAALAEGVLILGRNAPAQAVQLGVRRRVMERVPLGNVWSNHRAKVQLNSLDSAYASWALGCAEGSTPTVYAQGASYRLSVDAAVRFPGVRTEQTGISNPALIFGAASPALWLVRLPESADRDWWSQLQKYAAARGANAVLLGPRIPGVLTATWQAGNHGLLVPVGAETPATIAARPCPTGRDHATAMAADAGAR